MVLFNDEMVEQVIELWEQDDDNEEMLSIICMVSDYMLVIYGII